MKQKNRFLAFVLMSIMLSVNQMWAATASIIIDGSQLTGTATAAEVEKTYDGLTVGISAGARQISSIGTNKFTADAILIGKNGAYIYNKDPLPGIVTKFEIYSNQGASTSVSIGVNFSTTTISSYDADAENTYKATLSTVNNVYDCTSKLASGTKYFWFQVTNANNAQVEIRITYSQTPATVTLSEAGVETPVDDQYVGAYYALPPSSSQSCGTKSFVGWSTVEIASPSGKPASNFYKPGDRVLLGTTNTFFAVYGTPNGTENEDRTMTIEYANNASPDGWTINDRRWSASASYWGLANGTTYCMQSPSISDLSTVSNVKVTMQTYGTTSGSSNVLEVCSSSTTYGTFTATSSSGEKTVSKTGSLSGSGSLYFKSQGTVDGAGLRVTKITYNYVEQIPAYTGYTTACGPACSTAPSVGAISSSSVTAGGATLTCTGITPGADCSVLSYGFVYGTESNPALDGSGNAATGYTKVEVGTTTGGDATFNHALTGLDCNTTYYYKAYGKNGFGYAVSSAAQSFTTSACLTDHFIDNVQETTGYTGDGKEMVGSYSVAEVTIADKTPTTSGSCEEVHYHFVGWVTEANKAHPEGHIEVLTGMASGTTYYAVWAKEE